MNKNEYAEFHKYLAMLIYEYNQALCELNISEDCRRETVEVLQALEKVMKICVINKKN